MDKTKGCGCGTIIGVIALIVLIGNLTGGHHSSAKHAKAPTPTATSAHYDNSFTLQEVQGYFRNQFGELPYYAMITKLSVDQTSLSIYTSIYGLDEEAKQDGRYICAYANQLLKNGGTAIQRYEVYNQDGDGLCGGSQYGTVD